MNTAPDERKPTGGPPLTPDEREAKGQRKIGVWLPADAVEALDFLAKLDSEERGLPPERCRATAIAKSLVQRAEREKRRVKSRGSRAA